MMSVFDFIASFYDCGQRNKKPYLEGFKKEDIVLDLGGGTGEITQHLECVKVVCDISFPMLLKAHRKGMMCVRADASRLPFKQAFTKIIVVDALHHFKNREGVLREAGRILKSGGSLFIEDFDPSFLLTKMIALFERFVFEKSIFVSPLQLQAQLEKYGFSSFRIKKDSAEFVLEAMKA